jgi:5'-methylthioadenosine phosphorylase
MQPKVAIIGGTGVGDVLLQRGGQAIHIPTASGTLRGRIVDLDGMPTLLISRHSAGHKVPPHKVEYAAMALGLKQLGIKWCLASAAVGSLNPHWGAGTLVACSDFVDITGRAPTLYDREVVHTDFSDAFSYEGRQAIYMAGVRTDINVHPEGIYVCANGPRYETPYEVQLLGQIGHVIGMTAATEAICMREAGIHYAPLAVITNLASGISKDPLSHAEVVAEMKISGQKAVTILVDAARELVAKG